MTVFLVTPKEEYDGCYLYAVFSTRDLAQAYIQSRNDLSGLAIDEWAVRDSLDFWNSAKEEV
jgi:hypothetical protein